MSPLATCCPARDRALLTRCVRSTRGECLRQGTQRRPLSWSAMTTTCPDVLHHAVAGRSGESSGGCHHLVAMAQLFELGMRRSGSALPHVVARERSHRSAGQAIRLVFAGLNYGECGHPGPRAARRRPTDTRADVLSPERGQDAASRSVGLSIPDARPPLTVCVRIVRTLATGRLALTRSRKGAICPEGVRTSGKAMG
jgi:hypothetical protein